MTTFRKGDIVGYTERTGSELGNEVEKLPVVYRITKNHDDEVWIGDMGYEAGDGWFTRLFKFKVLQRPDL
jgi:hypothetical protein